MSLTSPASAGRFFTPEPHGKSTVQCYNWDIGRFIQDTENVTKGSFGLPFCTYTYFPSVLIPSLTPGSN